MQLPEDIERFILDQLGVDEPSKLRRLREELRRLTDDFSRRDPGEDEYSNAYFAYHFPSNLMKAAGVARELLAAAPAGFAERGRYEVLDLGCGEGAGMFGFFLAWNESLPADFFLRGIEASKKMIEKARVLADHLSARHRNLRVSLIQHRFSARPDREIEGHYDAILCVNALAEIVPNGPIDPNLISGLARRLKPGGVMVVIEPALKLFARRLMALRDELAKSGTLRVILPCLHDAACPLLWISTRDEWCHETRAWEPPAYLARLNQGLNREIDRLKYSYLVLSRDRPAALPKDAYRVLSRRLKEKGKMKCYLCAPGGRIEMVRLDKNQSPANAAFDGIRQGDVITVENTDLRGLYMRINKETSVTIVSN
jgi:ribosomal protein RSM22 (predicted rRNA methylase)